jgi:pimeloyl-ACP methyl ester carboxylesterase
MITIKGLVDHFEKQIRDLPEQPVLIGHSFGGLIVQMLLDRGLGAAGWQSMPVRCAACCLAPPRLGLRFPSS